MLGRIIFREGLSWHVSFHEDHCRNLAESFFRVFQPNAHGKDKAGNQNELRFSVYGRRNEGPCLVEIPAANHNEITFVLNQAKTDVALARQMIRLSQVMAHCSASRGAILMHGALASWKGTGVLLCGASGSGKTTASKRLPSPWQSLSDDATLLVRDKSGEYWAHPWPTWSRHLARKKSLTVSLGSPVRLHAIFFLRQSAKNGISGALPKESIIRLMAASEQAVNLTAAIMPIAPRNRQRVDRFDLCCDLARKLPTFHLAVSLPGKFWKLIEKAIKLQVHP